MTQITQENITKENTAKDDSNGLLAIAEKFRVPLKALQAANPQLGQTGISAGQAITIPNSIKHNAQAANAFTPGPLVPVSPLRKCRGPEYIQDLIIRLGVHSENAIGSSDQFILSSDQGYSSSKTLKDDLIAGDAYIDLLYEGLDTRHRYTLTQHFADSTDEQVHFSDVSYALLDNLS